MFNKLPKYILFFSIVVIGFQYSRTEKMSQQDFNTIQSGFILPQDSNKVWCYYYWIGDDISQEGVTKDLESMKEFGIGTVLIGNISPEEKDGNVPLFSDEWWKITTHAVNEGYRLGIDVGFFNSPGWSQSGGPWVTYDKAMRHLVYSETTINGKGRKTILLEKPANEFQDTHVLAFRKIESEKSVLNIQNSRISCSPEINNIENLLDSKIKTEALFRTRSNEEYIIDIVADSKIEARSLMLYPTRDRFRCDIEFWAEINGEFKKINSFPFNRKKNVKNCGPRDRGPLAVSLPSIYSNKFRLVCNNMDGRPLAGFSEILIAENEVLGAFVEKSLGKLHETAQPEFDSYLWDSQTEVNDKSQKIDQTIDLSDKMDKLGILTWDVPEGEWSIIRMGMTPTGTLNSPASPKGRGYEIDKGNEELVRFHFKNFIGEIIKRIPEKSLPALKYVVGDSYEKGSQNWSDGFERRFEAKYAYNPVKYLPTLSGRIVSSVEESDRFLWDLRRMVADDIAYEYVGGLRKIANENNLKLWLENYGHWGFSSEFMMYGGQSDLISGEYWNEGSLGDIECKAAASTAHIYNKPVVYAEAFTANGDSYLRHPAMLKTRGDWSFTEGINKQVLHVYIHQPDDDRKPGINATFSTEFNRHNTWFKQGKHWIDYLRRCQHMLQQGKYVADVLYFIGEDAPKMSGIIDPELPSGYSYDYINAEAIIKRLSVKNGCFVLPDGMKYKILAIPQDANIRPETLQKLSDLVKQGGSILGNKFKKSPSLQNFPACDFEIKKLSQELWGGEIHTGKLKRKVGKGYVFDGMGIQNALDFLNIEKDVKIEKDIPVLWTHRSLFGMEIYFLTNQSENKISFESSFRVTGLEPQLWNPVTGKIRVLPEYSKTGDRTKLPVSLEGYESCFIVFTNNKNDNVISNHSQNFPGLKIFKKLEKSWQVEFENKKIGPKELITIDNLSDWTKWSNKKAKYYSGAVTYKTSFTLDTIPKGEIFINLGNIGVMAEVKINGKKIGGVWISPFRLNTEDLVKSGDNYLEVKVVNLWRNRIIGDKRLPTDKRFTWTVFDDVSEDELLQPSGLLGPVTFETYISKDELKANTLYSK